ncbi:MAG: hypothetical protein BroJett011_75460 [Chloroflexota bacterium]|nr:MAG: hypothetical protein BroJett011_75460 [Chloroflexota bacterium]
MLFALRVPGCVPVSMAIHLHRPHRLAARLIAGDDHITYFSENCLLIGREILYLSPILTPPIHDPLHGLSSRWIARGRGSH